VIATPVIAPHNVEAERSIVGALMLQPIAARADVEAERDLTGWAWNPAPVARWLDASLILEEDAGLFVVGYKLWPRR
jgi:hypothetical protein